MIPVIDLHSRKGSASSIIQSAPEFESHLKTSGAVLIRGGETEPLETLSKAAQELLGAPMTYRFFVTPRRSLASGFLSATEAPPTRQLRFHNECSYLQEMPRFLLFLCRVPSRTGGRTLLAKTTDVLRALPNSLVQEFKNRRLQYHWLLPTSADLASKLKSHNADDAFNILRSLRIDALINEKGYVSVSTARSAVTSVGLDEEDAWVNHVWALHHSAIPQSLLKVYARQYGLGCVPHDVTFADGEGIDLEDVNAIGRAYELSAQGVEWAEGDVLVIDNFVWAHAREPYSGERDLRVQLYHPVSMP